MLRFLFLLQMLLLVLKLTNLISTSWVLLFIPTYFILAILSILGIIFMVVVALVTKKDDLQKEVGDLVVEFTKKK